MRTKRLVIYLFRQIGSCGRDRTITRCAPVVYIEPDHEVQVPVRASISTNHRHIIRSQLIIVLKEIHQQESWTVTIQLTFPIPVIVFTGQFKQILNAQPVALLLL